MQRIFYCGFLCFSLVIVVMQAQEDRATTSNAELIQQINRVTTLCASSRGSFIGFSTDHSARTQTKGIQPTEAVNDKELSFSRILAGGKIEKLAPPHCNLIVFNVLNGGVQKIENPLTYGHIKFLSLMEGENIASPSNERPLFVFKEQPTKLFLLTNCLQNNFTFFACGPVADATGSRMAREIIALATGKDHAFVAVAPQEGPFGTSGSGIAHALLGVVDLSKESVKELISQEAYEFNSDAKTIPFPTFAFTNAAHGLGGSTVSGCAYPLDNMSPILRVHQSISSDNNTQDELHILDDKVALHWNETLKRLYVGLHIKAGSSGAHALLVGRLIDNQKIEFAPLIDEAQAPFLEGIATALGVGDELTIHHLASLHTSTGVHYLIVQGGATCVSRAVYAIPLAGSDEENNGKMADTTEELYETYQEDSQRLFSRSFNKIAHTPTSLPVEPPCAKYLVGGGLLQAGDITSLHVVGDAVIVTVVHPDAESLPGIFKSQPLFDHKGAIKGWTAWQRVARCVSPTFDAAHMYTTGEWSYATEGMQENVIGTKQWSIIPNQQLLPDNKVATPLTSAWVGCIKTSTGNLHSLCALTMENTVLISHTAVHNGREFVPVITSPFLSSDESAKSVIEHTLLPFDSLDIPKELGSVSAVALANDTENGCVLLVGSDQALFYAHTHNIDTNNPLSFITAITNFHRVSAIQERIKKIVVDNMYAYALTSNAVYRIHLQAKKEIVAVRIANSATMDAHGETTFFDFLVSGPYALLGTATGLYHISPYNNVMNMDGTETAVWERVSLPERDEDAVIELFPITPTGFDYDLTHGTGGNLLVLTRSHSRHYSWMYRFAIQGIKDGNNVPVDIIKPLNDTLIKDIYSPLVKFSTIRHHIATDGITLMSVHNKSDKACTDCSMILPHLSMRVGQGFLGNGLQPLPVNVNDINQIISMKLDPGTGMWLIIGNDRLIING